MAIKILNPVAVGFHTDYGVTPPAGGGYSGDPVEYTSDTIHGTYISPDIGAAPDSSKASFLFDELPADVPGITPVARVTLFLEPLTPGCLETGPGLTFKALTRQGGADLLGTDLAPVANAGAGCSGPLAIENYTFPTKVGGSAWTVADLQGGSRAQFGVEIAKTSEESTVPSVSKLWLEVEYQALPPNFHAARDVASRIMRMRRRLCFTFQIGVPLWMLDAELLDDILVTYVAADDPKGVGWLHKVWERGWLKVIGIGIDRNTNQPTFTCLYMRDHACLHWDTMVSEATAGLYGQGVSRFDLGGVRTFTRPSGAWVKSGPTRGGQYLLAVDNVEKITEQGEIFMSARTNKLLHSSFIQGALPALTGWTFTATGGNTVEGEVIPAGIAPLFVEEVGARRMKITKVAAAEVQGQNDTVVSVGANVTGWASFGHLDVDASKSLKWAARRIVAGVTSWWDQGAGAFGAGGGAKVWNALTGLTTTVRVSDFKIPFGAGAGTIELMLGFNSAAANTTSYGYHASWIEAPYLSDELIVTTTAAYTVAVDLLSESNDSGTPAESERIMPESAFTWSIQAKTFWDPADLAAGEKRVIFANEFDANNSIVFLYDKDTARMRAEYKQGGGAPSVSSVAVTIAKNIWFTFGLRIIGASGQEDLTPYTMHAFADGSQGNVSAIIATPITMPSTGTLKRGHRGAGIDVWDGYLRHWETTHEVLSNEEIQGKP